MNRRPRAGRPPGQAGRGPAGHQLAGSVRITQGNRSKGASDGVKLRDGEHEAVGGGAAEWAKSTSLGLHRMPQPFLALHHRTHNRYGLSDLFCYLRQNLRRLVKCVKPRRIRRAESFAVSKKVPLFDHPPEFRPSPVVVAARQEFPQLAEPVDVLRGPDKLAHEIQKSGLFVTSFCCICDIEAGVVQPIEDSASN